MNLGELRTLFRSLIDDANVGGEIFSDSRVNILLYEGAQEVYAMLDNLNAGYGQTTQETTVTADATVIPQPTDATRIVKIEWQNGEWLTLFEHKSIEGLAIYRHQMGSVRNQKEAPVFALRGTDIVYPGPLGQEHTLVITYVQQLPNLSEDTDEWTTIPKFAHRLIAFEAALIGLVAEDSDARQHEQLTNRIRAGIIEQADNRNTGTPDLVEYYPD
jgi:hypothetical protein